MADDFGITLDPAQGRIDTDSGVIETDESFSIGITNEGSPTHVHFSLSDPLRKHLTLEGNNIYVEDSETVGVVVGPLSETVEGTLEITAEYGSHTEEVRVVLGGESGDDDAGLGSAIGATVSGGGGEEMEVDVDESLSQPVDVDYDEEEPRFTRVDYLVGALLGTAAFMMLLFALLFGGFTIAIVMLAFIILAASFFWVFKQYPYTGTERPKE